MFRIDRRNWETLRADYWHVGIFLDWVGQVRVLEIYHTFDEVMT